MKKYLALTLIPCFIFSLETNIVDCNGVVYGTTECNPYNAFLLKANKVGYDVDIKKPIISKTLPVPPKSKIEVISIEDMIERHVKVEDSLRFKSIREEDLSIRTIEDEVPKKIIENKINTSKLLHKIEKKESIVKIKIDRKLHILESHRNTKTHALDERQGVYKVVLGDTLGHIVSRYCIDKSEVFFLNNITQNDTVKIGQKLTLPISQKKIDAISCGKYMVEAGDSLFTIANKFNIKPKDLAKFNSIKSNSFVEKGKKLSLPLPYILKKEKIKKRRVAEENHRLVKKKRRLKMMRGSGRRKLRVTATAYTSHENQTDSTPFIAAWGNRIRPGMKMIAVSRDMLTRYGMKYNTKVRIGGLPGYYLVKDKMNKRYKKRIDIYMGLNLRRAFRWGRRSVTIYY